MKEKLSKKRYIIIGDSIQTEIIGLNEKIIQEKIYTIRNQKVMFDSKKFLSNVITIFMTKA